MSYQRDYERKLRVGMVGLGSHAYRNILPALHYLPVNLVALCDLDAATLANTGKEYEGKALFTSTSQMYQEMELDAVLLCVDPRHHPQLAIEAMEAGLHVWMEKPPAMRASQVQEMLDACGDHVCGVGFKKAYMPSTRKAKELLEHPEFGALRSLLAVYPMSMPADGRGILERGEYCNWLANGCHPLSLMLELGGRVRSVTTLLGPGEQAVGCVQLQFVSGAVGIFHLADGTPPGYRVERYDLFGAGKVISIENSSKIAYHRGIPFNYSMQNDFTSSGTESGSVVWEVNHCLATLENKALFVQGIFDELLDFCQAVLENRPLRIGNLEFALHVMQVYEAALCSRGNPVAIE
jgi:predicted dehydrogenase